MKVFRFIVMSAVFAAVVLVPTLALGEPCPPVEVNLHEAAMPQQEWWMVLLDFLLQLVAPVAIAVLTALAGIAVQRWGKKLDVDKQAALTRLLTGFVEGGISFAEEQGRKALRAGGEQTKSAEKLQAAVDYVQSQIDASGVARIAQEDLVKLIEARLQAERTKPDGIVPSDPECAVLENGKATTPPPVKPDEVEEEEKEGTAGGA